MRYSTEFLVELLTGEGDIMPRAWTLGFSIVERLDRTNELLEKLVASQASEPKKPQIELIDPGEGWRLIGKDEILQKGDEFRTSNYEWSSEVSAGWKPLPMFTYRRRITEKAEKATSELSDDELQKLAVTAAYERIEELEKSNQILFFENDKRACRVSQLETENAKLTIERDKALALVSSYDKQDESAGEDAESVDTVTEVIELKNKRISELEAALANTVPDDEETVNRCGARLGKLTGSAHLDWRQEARCVIDTLKRIVAERRAK